VPDSLAAAHVCKRVSGGRVVATPGGARADKRDPTQPPPSARGRCFTSCHGLEQMVDLTKGAGAPDRRCRLSRKKGPGKSLPLGVAPRRWRACLQGLCDPMELNKWWIQSTPGARSSPRGARARSNLVAWSTSRVFLELGLPGCFVKGVSPHPRRFAPPLLPTCWAKVPCRRRSSQPPGVPQCALPAPAGPPHHLGPDGQPVYPLPIIGGSTRRPPKLGHWIRSHSRRQHALRAAAQDGMLAATPGGRCGVRRSCSRGNG